MKTLGIIAEYNPFHKGHEYSINTLKEKTGADYCVIVMSGDYSQRGCPAIFDKTKRCKMALSCGADLVIELPVYYSTGSAEYFAGGAVSILDGLGAIDFIGFGSESGDIDALKEVAGVLCDEPEPFKSTLKSSLKSGKNYAAARADALLAMNISDTSIINSSNDILGIEYIKALLYRKSDITPVCIKREGASYHETLEDSASDSYPSAEGIRNILENASDEDRNSTESMRTILAPYIPKQALDMLFEDNNNLPTMTDENAFSSFLHYRLLCEKNVGFDKYMDVNPYLSDKIVAALKDYTNIRDFTMRLKSKDITYSHISRALLHILLGMTDEALKEYAPSKAEFTSYARILGLKKSASPLMKKIQECSRIPVLSRLSNSRRMLDELQQRLLNETIAASNVYDLVCGNLPVNEYAKPVITLR